MNISRLLRLPCLIGAILFAASTGSFAAPLAWFPGPSAISPLSGAATVVNSSLGNILIGGDGGYPYPEYLTATNQYWGVVPMPLYSVNIAPGAVAQGGMIILYGGTDGTSSQSTVIGYSTSDPAVSLASMSVARSFLGYASDASGNAYAIGGLDGSGNPLASGEVYNQDGNSWSAIASLPQTRYNFPAVFDRTNRIYIFGGYTDTTSGNEIATVYRYSTKSNNWTALAPMPVATAGSAAAFGKDGKIYVVGGLSGGVATDAVQVYDPSANSWVVSTPLPEALSGSAMGVDSLGRLIVMGGADINGNDVGDVWRSQPSGVADSAPAFTQFPATSAIYQQSYASTINASGNPPPTYQLLSGPSTMSVDYYSGAITWTPEDADIGTNTVTIQASNYSGSTNYTFTITVPNPPPGAVSNLTVVSVTDNSVTLSWTPESPLVGPTTYGAWLRHSIHDPKGSGGTVWYTQIGGTTTQPPFTITGLTAGTFQVYYIVATASGGSSGYTSAIGATTTAPQGPTNLVVTSVTPTTVGLAWSPSPARRIIRFIPPSPATRSRNGSRVRPQISPPSPTLPARMVL